MQQGLELVGEKLPPRLRDLTAPPERLYLHGELPGGPAVAIVGTREASAEGVAFARALALELATAGVVIWSGGAEGIDTAAHEGALDAGGKTVVVTPAGFHRPYPSKNAGLFRRVLDRGGAYLSLFPDEAPTDRATFFARNGVLAALSHVLVIAQTGFIGGSRNASKWARQLGRPVFVVPHSPWVEEGNGCVPELRLGARPLDNAKELLRFLRQSGHHGLPPAAPTQQELWPEPEGLEQDPVLAALQKGAVHADEIVELTGLSLATVQQRILTLALTGVLVPGPLGSLKLVTY